MQKTATNESYVIIEHIRTYLWKNIYAISMSDIYMKEYIVTYSYVGKNLLHSG